MFSVKASELPIPKPIQSIERPNPHRAGRVFSKRTNKIVGKSVTSGVSAPASSLQTGQSAFGANPQPAGLIFKNGPNMVVRQTILSGNDRKLAAAGHLCQPAAAGADPELPVTIFAQGFDQHTRKPLLQTVVRYCAVIQTGQSAAIGSDPHFSGAVFNHGSGDIPG